MRRAAAFTIAALMLVSGILAAPATRPTRDPASRPATSPATRPFGPELSVLRSRVESAEVELVQAKTRANERLGLDAAYAAARAEVAARDNTLQQARAGGTGQDKLDASSAFNKARAAAEKIKASWLAKDEGIKAAEVVLSEARVSLANAEDDARQIAEAAEKSAKAARDKDPIYIAIKEHRLLKGMSLEQAEAAMGFKGILDNEDELGYQHYRWPGYTPPPPPRIPRESRFLKGVPQQPYEPARPEYAATFKKGRLVEWNRY